MAKHYEDPVSACNGDDKIMLEMHIFIRDSTMHFKSRVGITFFFKTVTCLCLRWKESHTGVLLDIPTCNKTLLSSKLSVDTCLPHLIKSCLTEACYCQLELCELRYSVPWCCVPAPRPLCYWKQSGCAPPDVWIVEECGMYYRKNLRLKRKFRSIANLSRWPRTHRGMSVV